MSLTYRKLVMPEDLNPAHRLFGGRLLQWIDEAAAMYVMCQLQSLSIATVSMSEVVFKHAVKSGDFLEFHAETLKTGKSSITIQVEVKRKNVKGGSMEPEPVLSCQMTFVQLDETGTKTVPHRFYNPPLDEASLIVSCLGD